MKKIKKLLRKRIFVFLGRAIVFTIVIGGYSWLGAEIIERICK